MAASTSVTPSAPALRRLAVSPTSARAPSPVAPLGSAWTTGQNLQGVVGGGQLGYNYQFNPWLVLGVEADIQAADIGSHGNAAVGVVDAIGPICSR